MTDALLPVGFYDLLYPKTHHQRQVLNQLLEDFLCHGYQLVEPPLMEFDNALQGTSGEDVAALTFRVFDPQAHKMMAIRADMTPQIVRMVASRLTEEPLPLRLAYSGKVLRVVNDHFHAEREMTQSGIELIGDASPEADAEVIAIAISSLAALGVEALSVDFNIPSLARLLFEHCDIPETHYTEMFQAIEKKNHAQIERIGGKKATPILKLLSPCTHVSALDSLKLPSRAKPLIKHLQRAIAALQVRHARLAITIDLLGSQQFGYHTDMGFSIFSPQAKGELARGGRYTIPVGKTQLPATGISFYINEIFRTVPARPLPQRIYVPLQERDHTAHLQNQGYITIAGLAPEKEKQALVSAKHQQCQYVCVNGKKVSV